MPDSPPPFWDELTNEERQQWEELDDEQREKLRPCPVDVVRRELAKLRQQPDREREAQAEQDNNAPVSPRAETARTNTAALEGQQPTELTDEELLEELTDEERQQWDDLTNEEQAAILIEIGPLIDKPTQLKRQLRHLRQKGKAPNPDEAEAQEQARRQHNRPANDQRQPEPEPPKANRQALFNALLDATEGKSATDILDALARLAWAETHDNALCPDEQIPTPDQLKTWCNEKLEEKLKDVESLKNPHVQLLFKAVFQSIEGINWLWIHDQIQTKKSLPHPLAPIVEAWQTRPTQIEPDRRSKPIIGKTLIERYDTSNEPEPDKLDVPNMPGLVPYQSDFFAPKTGDVPSLIKTLHTITGDSPTRQGRAPLEAVYFFEGLLSTPTHKRDGQLHSMEFTRREIYEDWAGCDPRNFRGDRQAKLQDQALRRLSSIYVNIDEGWYIPLIVQAIEGPHLNSRVYVLVRLPPEAKQGPSVPRRILRELVPSKLAWFGQISICIHLDRYGGRQGRLIAATRPQVERNAQGQILGHKGEVLLDKKGYPTDRYTDKRAIQTGKREPNPEARKRYPALSKLELIALFYPLNPPTNSQDQRDKWKATQAALERIEKAGGITIEKGRTGWRIMPGDWAFAKHELLA